MFITFDIAIRLLNSHYSEIAHLTQEGATSMQHLAENSNHFAYMNETLTSLIHVQTETITDNVTQSLSDANSHPFLLAVGKIGIMYLSTEA